MVVRHVTKHKRLVRGQCLSALLGVALCLASSEALAQTAIPRRPTQAEWEFGVDLTTTYVPHLPPLTLLAVPDGFPRDMQSTELPSAGSLTAMGMSTQMGGTIDDRWVLQGFSFGVAFASGRRERAWATIDGSPVQMKPWTSTLITVGFLGVGFRQKYRRWMGEVLLVPQLRIYQMDVIMGYGGDSYDAKAHASKFAVVSEMLVCRRLDPFLRTCLLAVPTIYEGSVGNGLSVGLRLEVGP